MEDRLLNLLDELHAHGVEHDASEPDRLDRFRNLQPDTARVLALLVRATGARRLLELGTSNGYSTLWLADAVRSVGGRLVSIDSDAGRSAQARQNLLLVPVWRSWSTFASRTPRLHCASPLTSAGT